MPKLAIVAALEREVWPLVKDWKVSERECDGKKFKFFEKADSVLVCGGIGAQAARRACHLLARDDGRVGPIDDTDDVIYGAPVLV